jgi:hypothetical protein
MSKEYLFFDMDGVLLKHGGYHQALRASVKRIGEALGAPQTEINTQQIAQFEALSVTNEWDSLAICAALILIEVWQFDGSIRLTEEAKPKPSNILPGKPNFQNFLDSFEEVGPLPGKSAWQKITDENKWLSFDQRDHLKAILFNCRDIYHSLTLPIHQETVLGSQAFQEHYQLKPKLNSESFLLKYDHPLLSFEQANQLKKWHNNGDHRIGIITNRPNATPTGFISAPEAELGAKLVGLDGIPLLGSGILNWYAEKQCSLPQHTFLKPNPVHALGLMQICEGQTPTEALRRSVSLWQGQATKSHWEMFEGARVSIFEDSVKGLQSGIAAKSLLKSLPVHIQLRLIGVTENSIKEKALLRVADRVIPTINQTQWPFED